MVSLRSIILQVCFYAFLLCGVVSAQDNSSLVDEREKQLRELGVTLPKQSSIRQAASEEFAKPVLEQDPERLEEIAEQANSFSNLVTKITSEYDDYIRENSRYDFVVKEVRKAPIVKSLLSLDSEFKGIRNQAYLNLGIIALEEGKEMEAFLFFNDAFRLSIFDCSKGVDGCIRYQAEQQMKKMLGVDGESYIYWEK